MFTSNFP